MVWGGETGRPAVGKGFYGNVIKGKMGPNFSPVRSTLIGARKHRPGTEERDDAMG